MTKLLCAVTALAAGVAMADTGITSANVVGYQTKSIETTTEKATMQTMTFIKVDGSKKKLGDYVPQSSAAAKNWSSSYFRLNFYDSIGAQRKIPVDTQIATLYPTMLTDHPEWANSKVAFYYEKRNGKTEGWFLSCDSAQEYPMSDYELEDGDGFMMFVHKNMSPLSLTCSGAVDQEDTPIEITTSTEMAVLTGNVAPKELKLGDFAVSSAAAAKNWSSSYFKLNFYDTIGAQRKISDDTQIATLYPTMLTDHPEWANSKVTFYYEKRNGKTEGWFLACDSTQSYPMANYVVGSGDGFLMFAHKNMSPCTLTIPGMDLN